MVFDDILFIACLLAHHSTRENYDFPQKSAIPLYILDLLSLNSTCPLVTVCRALILHDLVKIFSLATTRRSFFSSPEIRETLDGLHVIA